MQTRTFKPKRLFVVLVTLAGSIWLPYLGGTILEQLFSISHQNTVLTWPFTWLIGAVGILGFAMVILAFLAVWYAVKKVVHWLFEDNC